MEARHDKPLKTLTLARYGGLNIVKQKNNYGRETFHSAPERYGFYAFIFPYIELFLVASTRENELKDGTYKKFNPKGGVIWTHLEPPKASMIITKKNSWYKVNVGDMPVICKKAFAVEVGKEYGDSIYGICHKEYNKEREKQYFSPMNKSPYAFMSKDHLEVFVCRDTII
jgi:hypothetical protein